MIMKVHLLSTLAFHPAIITDDDLPTTVSNLCMQKKSLHSTAVAATALQPAQMQTCRPVGHNMGILQSESVRGNCYRQLISDLK